EFGRNNNPDLASEPEFTINAESFLDLADQLGC
ncbi:MAG: Haloacid dehalogenase, type, partial [Acidobacteria bacterium]|nr:Haloacid dehalogenase, type [Acidobacteriota bacterium]